MSTNNAEEMFDYATQVAKVMNDINILLVERGMPELSFEALTSLSHNEMRILMNLLERNE